MERICSRTEKAGVVVMLNIRANRAEMGAPTFEKLAQNSAKTKIENEIKVNADVKLAIDTIIKKREGQVYIQTWHGTPLKRLGYDIEDNPFRLNKFI